MLRVKSLVRHAQTLKCGGGMKMWMWLWLCVERDIYIGFGNSQRKIARTIDRQKKDAKGVVYMAINQKAQETVKKVDSYCDGRELLRIVK